jgi:hypothetical protein
MCRIESKALQEAEGKGAAIRARIAEDRLILSTIRLQKYAITRRGGDPSVVSGSPEACEKMRVAIARLANYASGP